MAIPKIMKDIFWKNPFLSVEQKDQLYYELKKIIRHEGVTVDSTAAEPLIEKYIAQILAVPSARSKDYCDFSDIRFERQPTDPKLIAYYLPQMHPTPENDAWWGRGVTEWNNVSRAVPQYVGHYQPRLPGELGFYDLRLKENLKRQMELAKMYGLYGFSWYYYWFDGKRLLDRPLDMFVNDKTLDFPFCICWANESWTKGFFGSSKEVIMNQSETVESYRNFIKDAVKYLQDDRYITVQGKKLLIVYKPQSVPDCRNTLAYWREYCLQHGVGDIYILGCWTADVSNDLIEKGFDAAGEFQPGSILPYCEKINQKLPFINKKFIGEVYSYKDIVEHQVYAKNFKQKGMYNAVMPMWDNTPRRNDRGNVIYDGATPQLYKKWLMDVIRHYHNDCQLEDPLIFINAWNEWGEGAYLEPDRFYGYAYLEATKDAILACRAEQDSRDDENMRGNTLMIDEKNIGVIILNYNDSETTRKLCETIRVYDSIDHIAVVDNRSPDGSFAALQRLSDEKVDVLQSDKNGGYSYGNNFGAFYLMDHYHMDILLIANPDVEFTETFLIQVVRDMEKYQVQAASGYMKMPPHAIYPIMNKKINSCARETLECTLLLKKLFPFRGEFVRLGAGVQYVQWLPGSLFAIDAHVYRSLGGLDDRVFLFYEEQILGKKFLKAGYRMAVDTDISYFHNHSVSIRKSMKRYEAVKRLFLSKYFFYTEYGEISMTEKLLLRVAIAYGLFMRKWLYRVM